MLVNLSIENMSLDKPNQIILRAIDEGVIGAISCYDLRYCYKWTSDDLYDAYVEQYDYLQKWAKSISNDLLTLVRCMMEHAKKLDMPEDFLVSPKILLELVMVNPEYRNKGIASKLLKYLSEFFKCDIYGYVGNPLDDKQTTLGLLYFYKRNGYTCEDMGDNDFLISNIF